MFKEIKYNVENNSRGLEIIEANDNYMHIAFKLKAGGETLEKKWKVKGWRVLWVLMHNGEKGRGESV